MNHKNGTICANNPYLKVIKMSKYIKNIWTIINYIA